MPVVSADNLSGPEMQLLVKVPNNPLTSRQMRILYSLIECWFVSVNIGFVFVEASRILPSVNAFLCFSLY